MSRTENNRGEELLETRERGVVTAAAEQHSPMKSALVPRGLTLMGMVCVAGWLLNLAWTSSILLPLVCTFLCRQAHTRTTLV